MNDTPKILTERIDDFILLIEVIKNMGVMDAFDCFLPKHGLHQCLSWDWLGTIWLAHVKYRKEIIAS